MRNPVRLVRAAVDKLSKGLPSVTVNRQLKKIEDIKSLAQRIDELEKLRDSLARRNPTRFTSDRKNVAYSLAKSYHASAKAPDIARTTMRDYVLAATHYHQAGKTQEATNTIGELLSHLETFNVGVLGRVTEERHFRDIETAVATIPGAKRKYGQQLISLKRRAMY